MTTDDLLMEAVARATCPSRPAGAVLHCVSPEVEFVGYEGAPHGLPHCEVVGCRVIDGVGCVNAVPAEVNALLRAARSGVSTLGATLEVSMSLDPLTAGAIVNAGVAKVVCHGPVARGVRAMLELAAVQVEERDD